MGIKYEPLSDPPSLKYVSGAPGLSTLISTSLIITFMSLHNCFKNLDSCTALASEMCSASQVDKATVCCFRLFHEINGPFSVN